MTKPNPFTLISKWYTRITLILLLFMSQYTAFAQTEFEVPDNVLLNYSFEYLDVFARPVSWLPQNTKDQYVIKTYKDPFTKLSSLMITPRPNAAADRGAGLCNTVISALVLKGKKKITVKANIKTKDLADGVASLWMQLNGSVSILADVNSDAKSAKGTTDWQTVTIELPIPEDAVVQMAVFGCKMTGTGVAYFDEFEVFLDGERVRDIM